jgi:phosphoribosylanthranilate isomerase
LAAVQLHGDERYAPFRNMGVSTWRAVRFEDGGPVPAPNSWPAARYVVDAAPAGEYGGSGTKADWQLAAEFAGHVPVMLAGGLNPGNVAEAVHVVRPAGVDVSSGVEQAPGRKDHGKLKSFVEHCRAAAEEAARE